VVHIAARSFERTQRAPQCAGIDRRRAVAEHGATKRFGGGSKTTGQRLVTQRARGWVAGQLPLVLYYLREVQRSAGRPGQHKQKARDQ